MGLEVGAKIRGVKLRAAPGYNGMTNDPLSFKKLKIVLSQGRSSGGCSDLSTNMVKNLGKNRKTVRRGGLLLKSGAFPTNPVFPISEPQGDFGQTIWFEKPYTYTGGNGGLILDITSSGQPDAGKILLEAITTPGFQGVHKTLEKGAKSIMMRAVPLVEFVY